MSEHRSYFPSVPQHLLQNLIIKYEHPVFACQFVVMLHERIVHINLDCWN